MTLDRGAAESSMQGQRAVDSAALEPAMDAASEASEEAGSSRETLEIRLLLDGVFRQYGYDFRNYALASIRRRILSMVKNEGLNTISGLQERALHDVACMERLLAALTVHVTAMYRDPGFYRAFRRKVVPALQTYPFVRIWHAGCSTGQEVYSLAILLSEEGLYDRCRIYATDLSEAVLRTAREGVFPLGAMKEYTENYVRAEGKAAFSEYYTARYDHAVFRPALRENIVFAPHNLVTDGSFNEFNVILCRNVMIYFNRELQNQVHDLLHRSLARLGVLGLGKKESLRFTPHEDGYQALDESERIYRKLS
jgi:chemotaxis protein methyltransferase CheR